MLRLLRADIVETRRHYARARQAPVSLLAVLLYRIGHRLWQIGLGDLSHLTKALNMMLTGADFDHRARIGPGLCLQHPVGVVVGHNVQAGANLHLFGGTVLGWTDGGPPTLGENVTVYAKASVVGPVTIGDDAVIGPHALVMRDVGPGEKVFGPRSERPSADKEVSRLTAGA